MATMSYENRPSKAITRRIFVEALRKISVIRSFSEYRYVGFGAVEFIDFDMVHRAVGISRMISIESDIGHIDRYRANVPFNGIDIVAGRSTTALSSIDWTHPSIVWLDYTSALNESVLSDIDTLGRVLKPGSVLAVTLNCHPVNLGSRRDALERSVGAERVPIGVDEAKLGGWGTAAIQWRIFNASLTDVFSNRIDGGQWHQVLNLNYQDAAKMQLIVGVVETETDKTAGPARVCEMEEYRNDSAAQVLKVPLLTAHEQTLLNKRLPHVAGTAAPTLAGVKTSDVNAYMNIYKWLDSVG